MTEEIVIDGFSGIEVTLIADQIDAGRTLFRSLLLRLPAPRDLVQDDGLEVLDGCLEKLSTMESICIILGIPSVTGYTPNI